MKPVQSIEGRAYPLNQANIDTDTIIAGSYLKTISRAGLGHAAFQTIRASPDNVFDDPEFTNSPILIAGDNFGCGSSREHAAWAMLDMGIKAVIAPGFSDIFASNAFKNGLLTVVLPQRVVDRLIVIAEQRYSIDIDLDNQVVTTPFQDRFTFEIDAFRKDCLLRGMDEIGITLDCKDAIDDHERRIAKGRPWIGRAPSTDSSSAS